MQPPENEYDFRPATEADLPLIAGWLAEPHVREWWGDPDEQLLLIQGDLDSPAVSPWIVRYQGKDFAYLQSWDVRAFGEFTDQPTGTRGLDPFIGRPEMVGAGHGPRFLRLFAERLASEGVPHLVIDPDVANTPAIRAYAKAGFREVGRRESGDGTVLLMAWGDPTDRASHVG